MRRRVVPIWLVVLTLGCVGCDSAAALHPVLTRVDGGVLRGERLDGVDAFRGIPYAAAPVGALRWRAPQPFPAWSGVRAATALPPACPQAANGAQPRSTNEDCLFLSVYRPAVTTSRERSPVLFWIHGGGLISGSGNEYDGTLLARSDKIVVVSINYRLGIFGFLALPSLDAEATDAASGDYGLLDQEAALRWVHDNIGAFGGDPANVTIAGESAGGYSVCALLASAPVRGLFSRAIIESGSCASQSLATAQVSGTAFADAAGCTDPATAAACLRRLPAGALLDDPDYPSIETPTYGGSELPLAPASAVSSGQIAHVPVLIGTNHDEGRTFSQSYAYDSKRQYVAAVDAGYGSLAPQILARYPWTSFPAPYTAAYALGAVWTDSGEVAGIGGCATRQLAGELSAQTATYFYQFDNRDTPGLDDTVPGYQWGAGHATELPYLWPSISSVYAQLDPAERALSGAMVNYWGAFARSGTPEVAGQRAWPRYSSGAILSLRPGAGASVAISDAQFSAEHSCAFWDALPGEPG